jgi:hypothetical protein
MASKPADGNFCTSHVPNNMPIFIPAARTKKRILMYFTHMFMNDELRNSMTEGTNCLGLLPEKEVS